MIVKQKRLVRLCVFFIMVVHSTSVFTYATAEEQAPRFELEAAKVVPSDLITGLNYVVNEQVENDGLINTYLLTTVYGQFWVESTAKLLIRIAELNAIDVMAAMDQKKVFGDAVLEGMKAPIRGAESLVNDPVGTSKGIVKGTGRFLSNIGRSIVSEDPFQDNTLKVVTGYDAARRGYAYELGIDPYSDFEPLSIMLGKIAQASAAGGMTPQAAMAAINVSAVKVLSLSGTTENMRKLVRDNPPGELREINKKKLQGIGVPTPLVEAFLNNYFYTPYKTTLLVGHLEQLRGVKGRDEFLNAANLVSDRSSALFYRVMAELMAGYHEHISPAERIDRAAGVPYLIRTDGVAVLLLPVDYIFRTPDTEEKLARLDKDFTSSGVKGKELWITGKVDERAREMFKSSGWEVVENVAGKL